MSQNRSSPRTGGSHESRKLLFQSGLRRGFLTVQEIESALPEGSLTSSERWLLYYSLRASGVSLRDETGRMNEVVPLSTEERVTLETERGQSAWEPEPLRADAERETGEAEADEAREIHLGLGEQTMPLDG